MLLALMPAWGYATAASTLVGQRLGANDPDEAADYGWQTLRIALATQLLIGAAIFLAAGAIARSFGAGDVALTVTFIRVFGLGVAGFSVSRTLRGGLRGAGDTRWPFYGGILGTYAVRLPLAFAALPVGYAIAAGPFALGPLVIPALSVAPGWDGAGRHLRGHPRGPLRPRGRQLRPLPVRGVARVRHPDDRGLNRGEHRERQQFKSQRANCRP